MQKLSAVDIRALARTHRWKRMLDAGKRRSIAEIAEVEKIDRSFVSRLLRLTLLAPDIVEAILNGRQGPEVTLAWLLDPFPVEWAGQRDLRSPCDSHVRIRHSAEC